MKSVFKSNENCAVCFWSWNNDISEEEIYAQMSDFADGRIGGVVIHARAGLKIPYMGKQWMQLFKFAVEKAQELGLEVWIYDEDGWPSGFASGKVTALGEEYWLKRLKYDYAENINICDFDIKKIIAVYQKENDKYKRVDNFSLEMLPKDAIVFCYSEESCYVDLLNPKVTEAFISFTHEEYKKVMGEYFGTVIKGFFTDEPQLNGMGYVWSNTLAEEYLKITGNDLLDDMWMIAVESKESHPFRYKLWSIISDLYFNNFVKRIAFWCEENNLKQTGHFPAEDGLVVQLPACGEVMRNYTCMQLPAIDHLGSRVASPVLMKQVSSVSRQYRDGNVLSETFGCAGWGVTFRKLQWIWGGQSVLGITKPCYHLSAYSMEGRRKRDYPAFYSYQEPWWDDFRSFFLWMNNLNSLMIEGERELHILVVPPMSGFKYLYNDGSHRNDAMVDLSSEYRCLLENLIDLQLDFDLGDERLICADSTIDNGIITLGKISYDTIILSKTEAITPEFYSVLENFVKSGGKLFAVDRLPEYFTNGVECNVKDLVQQVLPNRRDTLEKYIEMMDIYRPVIVVRTDDLKPISNIAVHTRKTSKGRVVHIWPNKDFMCGKAYLHFDFDAVPYKINLIDNTKEPLLRLESKKGYLVPVTINKEENLVIELVNGETNEMKEYSLVEIKQIQNIEIKNCEKNSITLDFAEVSVDGGKVFGEPQQILKILEFIYSQNNTDVFDVVLRYRFNCGTEVDLASLSLAIEDETCSNIKVNGTAIPKIRDGWWIDRCIGVYNIGTLVNKGENFVDLYYEIPPVISEKSIEDAFETEKNRFYYPCEPDCIYILGNFDVATDSKVYNNGFCYQTKGDFSIEKSTTKAIGDLTSQGMWFYRGNVCYDFSFDVEKTNKRTILSVEDYNGTMIVLNIGNKRLVSHSCPAKFDISEMVVNGRNEINIQLIGNNRNLLGPHHHINGESYIVCPATFEGEWNELSDLLSPALYDKPTYTDDYGFVPFGINIINIELYN